MRQFPALLSLLLCMLLAVGCDKLEDGDATAGNLPGRWAFSYTTDEPIDYDLSYRYVEFWADGTCALVYEGGELDGTYRAGQALIRIEAEARGEQHVLLWVVQSMSPQQIVARYDHELGDGRRVAMTVTLDRLPAAASE